MEEKGQHGPWRRILAILVSSLVVLGALIAVRGPDPVGPASAELVGSWLLTGPALWTPLTLSGASTQAVFAMAGARGWQNAHVAVAWLAVLCWFLALPDKSWRGLGPLVPALLAVVLSGSESGWGGFGLALLTLSCWRVLTRERSDRVLVCTLPVAAWFAVWFSPAAVFLVAASVIEIIGRLPRRTTVLCAVLCVVSVQLTPWGLGVWPEANKFLFWSPQPELTAPAIIALLCGLAVLALAAGHAWRHDEQGLVLAPALLLSGAACGQNNLLWPALLWLIPCWPAAIAQWRNIGFNFRWWMQAGAIFGAGSLVFWASLGATPRWYALAMTNAAVHPSLTRDALPAKGRVYVNPRGLALARLAGELPEGAQEALPPNLGREPSLWRSQDRKTRYAAVWLLGDTSDYAPLARHLGESPDWRLQAVDATGLVFVRAPRSGEFATEPAQQTARESMWGGANRSGYLAGCALACLAADALPEAAELAAAAVKHSDLSAPAAAARARVLISVGDVRGALEQSAKAIDLDPSLPLAWEVRTEALLHAGLADDAYAASKRAVSLAPGNAGILWLAARAANAARALQSEAEILEGLIALTKGRGADAGFYELYLGQSYAKQGLARPALRALESAAKAPGLTDEQRAELQREIGRVRESAEHN